MNYTYMATVLPGLEEVLVDEIKIKLPDVQRLTTTRGKVFFESPLPWEFHLQLRTVDNLYQLIGRFFVGSHKRHLPQLEKQIAAFDLSFVKSIGRPEDGYVVNASRKGKQTYSRFEAAEAAMQGIAKRYPGWVRGTAQNHALEFRLDLDGEEAVFSLRLTNSTFRFRGSNRFFSQAALRPTIAHALVWCSSPEDRDVFVDPCCGSGTILYERLAYPFVQMRGGDLSDDAIQSAKANLKASSHSVVQRWDARQLPLDSGSVDKFVSNLPFGRQIGSRAQLGNLYGQLVQEMARVLKPGGRAILLVEDGSSLVRAADRCSIHCCELMQLSLKGLRPTIYQLNK
ncbi:methyltransferase domain-containing protein [Desmospora activa]|uniref:23S rRNA G2445 N2-methylase RlmL n=1 Tax=Desmospora activa DSM 45169 TaxID=1121389 RepID=A0A2T4Z404_9BACL|nr:methyltransferase domain-containing protein [Desmospora activa]PTM56605.1 23S rRNA G2445 N2-methylase RlmL [Desmospora activa DSM 45169]